MTSRIKTNGLLMNRLPCRLLNTLKADNLDEDISIIEDDDEILYPFSDTSTSKNYEKAHCSNDSTLPNHSRVLSKDNEIVTTSYNNLIKKAEGQLANLKKSRLSNMTNGLITKTAQKIDHYKKKLDQELRILDLLLTEYDRLEGRLNLTGLSAETDDQLRKQLGCLSGRISDQRSIVENLEFQLLEDQIYLEEELKRSRQDKEQDGDDISDIQKSDQTDDLSCRDSLKIFLQYEKLFKDGGDSTALDTTSFSNPPPVVRQNEAKFKLESLTHGEQPLSKGTTIANHYQPTTATTKLPIMTIKEDVDSLQKYGFQPLNNQEYFDNNNLMNPETSLENHERIYHSDPKMNRNLQSGESSTTSTPNHKSWPIQKPVSHLETIIAEGKNKDCTESSESMLSSNENSSYNQKSNKNSFELDEFDSGKFRTLDDFERRTFDKIINKNNNSSDPATNTNGIQQNVPQVNQKLMISYYESQCNPVIPEKDVYMPRREDFYSNEKIEIRDRVSRLPFYNNLSIYENQKSICPSYDMQIMSGIDEMLMVNNDNNNNNNNPGIINKSRLTLPVFEDKRSSAMKTISATTSPDPSRKLSILKARDEISSEKCKRRNIPVITKNDRSRPLTRYLPAPDRDEIDLRSYLESMCSYDLNTISTKYHITIQKDKCFGFLYKMTSRSVHSNGDEAIESSKINRSFLALAKRKALNLIQRHWKKRWFLLDRRRRIITYFDNEIDLSSNQSSIKPKALISFADIVNVIPDIESGINGTTFNMILLSNGTKGDSPTVNFKLKAPNHECMRIWQDVLFLCAGAYSLFKKN